MISVDLRDADVEADLGTPAGRADAVAAVQRLTDVVHGVVPAAGVAGLTGTDPRLVASVNYFGAVELVRGLHPQLTAASGAAVVFLASNSVTCQPDWPADLARTLLAGDEPAALRRGGAPRGGAGVPGHQGRARVVGAARGRQAGVGRRRRPAQLRGAREDRDAR